MRSVVIPRYGDPDVLVVRDLPEPTPKPGEVKVRVRAAGLNFAEVMARKGMYPDAPRPPLVAGYEVSGLVTELGAGASRFQIGDRVGAMVRFGGHAEAVCVPEHQVFRIPDGKSFEDAAAIPVNYLTAYHMLFDVFRARAGDHVLIHAAAGGVGTAALQLCRTLPGITTYGTASAAKHAYLREQGCDHPIDRAGDYVAEVRRLRGDEGIDLVLDALGGPDWAKGYSLLRPGGHLIAFGWANMSSGQKRDPLRIASQFVRQPVFSLMRLMNDNRAIAGTNMGHLWHQVALLEKSMTALSALWSEGRIAPHVDKVFPFAEAAAAHRWLEEGKNLGKVVLVP